MEPYQKRELLPNTYIRLENTATLLQNRKLQLDLLELCNSNNTLLQSNIICSITSKIGKVFEFPDLENCKSTLIMEFHRNCLQLAITVAERYILNDFNLLKQRLSSDISDSN